MAGAAPVPLPVDRGGSTATPDAGLGGSSSGELEPGPGGAAGDADAGLGGEAGAPAPPACASGASVNWELEYFPELREATAQESHPFFRITDHGQSTTLDRIAVRYYFTKESTMMETGVCFWVTGDRCARAKFTFGDAPGVKVGASRYMEVSFPGASDVTMTTESLEVRVGFKTGSAVLVQSNDYSFDRDAAAPSSASSFPYKKWHRATLYVDGKLVWGTEPCSSSAAQAL